MEQTRLWIRVCEIPSIHRATTAIKGSLGASFSRNGAGRAARPLQLSIFSLCVCVCVFYLEIKFGAFLLCSSIKRRRLRPRLCEATVLDQHAHCAILTAEQ